MACPLHSLALCLEAGSLTGCVRLACQQVSELFLPPAHRDWDYKDALPCPVLINMSSAWTDSGPHAC